MDQLRWSNQKEQLRFAADHQLYFQVVHQIASLQLIGVLYFIFSSIASDCPAITILYFILSIATTNLLESYTLYF